MFKDKINYRLINILVLMLVLYIGVSTVEIWGGIVGYLFQLVLPFIIAFAIAYALYPFVRFLEGKGVRKQLAVLLVVVALVLFIVSLISVTLPLVYEQLILFSKMVIEVLQDISSKFDINLGEAQVAISDALNNTIKGLGKIVSDGTMDVLGKSINLITQTVVVFIVSVYFLVDMDKIRNCIKRFLKRMKNRWFDYVKSLDKEIGNYLKGLALFMLVQLIEYCLVFFLVGHPNWLLLGILASVTTIIPYFGGLVTNVIAVITASVVSTPVFIGTLIICLLFPQIDGYIISPKIYGKTNNINPIWSIFVVVVGGSIGGLLGIIIALPLFILISCTYRFFKKDIESGIGKVKKSIE